MQIAPSKRKYDGTYLGTFFEHLGTTVGTSIGVIKWPEGCGASAATFALQQVLFAYVNATSFAPRLCANYNRTGVEAARAGGIVYVNSWSTVMRRSNAGARSIRLGIVRLLDLVGSRQLSGDPDRGRRLRHEALEGRLLLADFGDAPAPYPTTLAENGTRHEEVGPMLGAARDSEPNGVHSVGATADGPDDDGVTFGEIRVGQLGATVTVNVQNAPAGVQLYAWIDFNGDGNWGGAGERIARQLFLANGDNTVRFDVPAWAVDGQTYARFRITNGGFTGVRGAAFNGEVEDYAVTILPPVPHAPLFDGQRTITTGASGARGVHAADIDGDGDMDVISASADNNDIVWYENNESQGFTARLIDGGISDAASVFAADIDGDGDMDVLSSSDLSGSIQWNENDGTPANGTWPRHAIYNNGNGAVIAADMDGDGDMDILTSSMSASDFYWFENKASGGGEFTCREVVWVGR